MGKANITLEIKRKKDGIVYSLTLHGHGNVVYKSGNHVKMKDISDIPIKKSDFIELLTDFQNFSFPSEKSIKPVDEDLKDDYTYVLFEINYGKGKYEDKEVIHYNSDDRISQSLKDLENRVDILTKSSEWLKSIKSEDAKKTKKLESDNYFETIKKTSAKPEEKKAIERIDKPSKTAVKKTEVKKSSEKIEKPVVVKEKKDAVSDKKIKKSSKKVYAVIAIAIVFCILLIVFIPGFFIEEKTLEAKVLISTDILNGDSPLMVNFNASIYNFDENVFYLWDFGDNVNSTMKTTSHTYLEPGTYNVVLTVTDAYGRSAIDTLTVNVY